MHYAEIPTDIQGNDSSVLKREKLYTKFNRLIQQLDSWFVL
jgi:hypothetical protein